MPNCYDSPDTGSSCSKQKILFLTGPDAYTEGIDIAISEYGIQHRSIPFNKFVYNDNEARDAQYKYNGIKHYSSVNDPLYI